MAVNFPCYIINCILIKNFLGVGVDIRVHHAIIFGLSENAESLLQEGGRPMRGGPLETQNQHGLAFFFHKGSLGKVSVVDALNHSSYCYIQLQKLNTVLQAQIAALSFQNLFLLARVRPS